MHLFATAVDEFCSSIDFVLRLNFVTCAYFIQCNQGRK